MHQDDAAVIFGRQDAAGNGIREVQTCGQAGNFGGCRHELFRQGNAGAVTVAAGNSLGAGELGKDSAADDAGAADYPGLGDAHIPDEVFGVVGESCRLRQEDGTTRLSSVSAG